MMSKKKASRAKLSAATASEAGDGRRIANRRRGDNDASHSLRALLESLTTPFDPHPTSAVAEQIRSRTPPAPASKYAGALWQRGLLGVGFGVKESAGGLTPTIGLRVYVRAKRPWSSLSRAERVPVRLFENTNNPLLTDVVAVGSLRPLAKRKNWKGKDDVGRRGADWKGPDDVSRGWRGLEDVARKKSADLSDDQIKDLALLRSSLRPLLAGASVGPELPNMVMTGTLGALVTSGGQTCILSNNHVLADSTLSRLNQSAVKLNDPIYQPGTLDRSAPYQRGLLLNGANESGLVARLSKVEPIKPSNPVAAAAPQVNYVDAALARLEPAYSPANHRVFGITGPAFRLPGNYDRQSLLLKAVAKVGRTTASTLGVVVDVNVRSWIPYGADEDDLDRYAWFEEQIGVVPVGTGLDFSDSGDSGSGVFDPLTSELVGLLFAGSTGFTLVNPIDRVLAALDITGLA